MQLVIPVRSTVKRVGPLQSPDFDDPPLRCTNGRHDDPPARSR